MSEVWPILAVLSPAFYAVNNVVDKHLLSEFERTSKAYLALIAISQFAFSGVLVLFQPFSLSDVTAAVGILVGLLLFLGLWAYVSLLTIEQASSVVSIMIVSPAVVALLANLLLRELLTVAQYLGVLVTICGTFLVTWKTDRKRADLKQLCTGAALLLLFPSASVIEKWALRSSDYRSFYFLTSIGGILAAACFLSGESVRQSFLGLFHQMKARRAIRLVALNESANCLAQLCWYAALAHGPVTIVNAISSIQLMFVVIYVNMLGFLVPRIWHSQHEEGSLRKLLAGLVMFFGIYLLGQ